MKFTCFALFLILGTSLGFADDAKDPGSKSLREVRSITARADGRYDVVCNDGRREIAFLEEIQADKVCNPSFTPPANGQIVKGQDRTSYLSGNTADKELINLGQNIWDGYVSFEVSADKCYSSSANACVVTIVDGLNQKWERKWSDPTTLLPEKFDRLVMPVRVIGKTTSGIGFTVSLKSVSYEITKTKPYVGFNGQAKADVRSTVYSFGSEIPGVAVSFSIRSTFFLNFTNGNACSRFLVRGQDRALYLDAKTPQQTISKLVAPISIIADPICQSSRLARPENTETDQTFAIAVVQVGNPL